MDIKLNYIEKGAGEVLILLHGNGENLDYFEHQIEFFSQYYKVIAIDTRGHGRSPKGTKPFTIVQFAEDLYDFMVYHKIAKANILGFSDGGNIALTFALKHPDMVGKLILNGANLNPGGVKLSVQLPVEIEYRIAHLKAAKNEKMCRKADFYGLMVKEPDFKPSDLAQLYIPTLVIAGTDDMIKTSHTQLIYKSLPDAQLCFIKGDHFIANKEYGKFNSAVYKFLKE